MFPIRDHNPSGRTPYIVYGLLVLNVAVYLLSLPVTSDPQSMARFYLDYATIPARIASGEGIGTLVTSMFLHAGLMHLAGNMLFLWIFGDNLEDKMGHGRFLLFYLACGIGAALVHVLMAPYSTVPTVGASGAIAGVMGGYLLLFPRARVDILLILIVYVRVFPIPAWIMLAVWFGTQFLGGFSADPKAGGVAYWAHVGGFVIGLLLCVPLWARLGGPAYWNRTHGHPPHAEARYKLSPTRIPKVPRR